MVSQRKWNVLCIYIGVVLIVFSLCVPLIQERLHEKNRQPKAITVSPADEVVVDNGETASGRETGPATGSEAGLVTGTESAQTTLSEPGPDFSKMIWPLEGQVFRGVGISYAQTFSDYRYHDGIDIQAARGAEVVAALPGKVSRIETTKEEKTVITIEHGQGWVSVYAHLEKVFPAVGDYCELGDILGTVNQPGLQEVLEGPHLHFSLRQEDKIVNPLDYLPERP